MDTKHAVLTRTHLFISEDCRVRKVNLDYSRCFIYDMYDLAREHQITHLWLMPEVGVIMDVPAGEYTLFATYEDGDTFDEDGGILSVGAKERPMFAVVRKPGTWGEIKIGWPHHGNWGWLITEPIDVLATIHYLERVLGVPIEWSPGHVGTELVRHLNRTARRADWVRDASFDLFRLPFKATARNHGGDLRWANAAHLKEGAFLHQYDKRSAYLAACQDLHVGAGDPVHRVFPDSLQFDTLPGIYRVEIITNGGVNDGCYLPEIITTAWVTSDVLTYAIARKIVVRIDEAWQWEEEHKTLASYADKLWRARFAFREDSIRFPHEVGRTNAELTMKEIALVATGKFGSEKKTSQFRQPYWWAAVVGKARVIMLANMYKIYSSTGKCPALIYSDSVYYASDERDPRAAVPGILDREDKLGGFRHDGTWKITAEMIEQFNTKKAGDVQKYLEHLPKE